MRIVLQPRSKQYFVSSNSFKLQNNDVTHETLNNRCSQLRSLGVALVKNASIIGLKSALFMQPVEWRQRFWVAVWIEETNFIVRYQIIVVKCAWTKYCTGNQQILIYRCSQPVFHVIIFSLGWAGQGMNGCWVRQWLCASRYLGWARQLWAPGAGYRDYSQAARGTLGLGRGALQHITHYVTRGNVQTIMYITHNIRSLFVCKFTTCCDQIVSYCF